MRTSTRPVRGSRSTAWKASRPRSSRARTTRRCAEGVAEHCESSLEREHARPGRAECQVRARDDCRQGACSRGRVAGGRDERDPDGEHAGRSRRKAHARRRPERPSATGLSARVALTTTRPAEAGRTQATTLSGAPTMPEPTRRASTTGASVVVSGCDSKPAMRARNGPRERSRPRRAKPPLARVRPRTTALRGPRISTTAPGTAGQIDP